MIRGAIRLMRPRQWSKNVLVGAAPLAAGTILRGPTLLHTVLAFTAFCLASSATYCLNDVMDAEADAKHPTKRRRPVASGQISRPVALVLALVLAIVAVALPGPSKFHLVVLGYLVLTASYSLWLKHRPVLELGLVSGGFLLRAMAGGLATALPLSKWFLIVTAFGSLFMVTGKRLSELISAEHETAIVRRSLTFYPLSYLRMVLGVSAGVTITGYCLWAFEVGAAHRGGAWSAISVAPFVLGLMRYGLDSDLGNVEEPEEVVRRDTTLQILGLLWLVTFSLGVAL